MVWISTIGVRYLNLWKELPMLPVSSGYVCTTHTQMLSPKIYYV